MKAMKLRAWVSATVLLLLGVGSAYGAAAVTLLISTDSTGAASGNSHSYEPSLSADGRFVAFASEASNLVPGDTNDSPDVFVRDWLLGATERVNIRSGGGQSIGAAFSPSISADGRFVAFWDQTNDLVAGDTNGVEDVFVRDRLLGTTERISVTSAGAQAIGGDGYGSVFPEISADGRFVAFLSFATNLVAGDTNGRSDIFVRDRQAGTTERVSVSSAGAQATGEPAGTPPMHSVAISVDGRFVAFRSAATNLVSGDTNSVPDVFVRDRQLGTTERVNLSNGGTQGDGASEDPSISADGRFVAFPSYATNLVSGDTNLVSDVFVRDRQLGTTERVSLGAGGTQSDSENQNPEMSADGRFVAFESWATNLVANDTNGTFDIFVRDRSLGVTERKSVDQAGGESNGHSEGGSISADGRLVAFTSDATNLLPRDTNGFADVFLNRGSAGTENQPPVADPGSDIEVTLPHDGDPVTNVAFVPLDGSRSYDPDGTLLLFEWLSPGDILFSRNPILVMEGVAAKYTLTLQVTDAFGAKARERLSIRILPEPNAPPRANAGPDQQVTAARGGTPGTGTAMVTLNGGGSSDPDGDTLAYSWRDGAGVEIGTAVTLVRNLTAGKHTFTLRATDTYGAFGESRMSVRVLPESNRAPLANAGPDQKVAAGHASGTAAVTLSGHRSGDPDGDAIGFSWRNIDGVELGAAATLDRSLTAGKHTFLLRVADPYGSFDEDRVSVHVQAAPNAPPVAEAGTDQAVADGGGDTTAVTLIGTASTDPDGDTLTHVWREDGAQLATGASPAVNLEPGRHLVELTVSDPTGASSSDTVTVLVGLVDVTGLMSVRKLVPTAGPGTGKMTARVRVTNRSGGGLPGPITLVLDGLTAAKVNNETGLTTSASGAVGKPYFNSAPSVPRGTTREFVVSLKGRFTTMPGPCRILAGVGPR